MASARIEESKSLPASVDLIAPTANDQGTPIHESEKGINDNRKDSTGDALPEGVKQVEAITTLWTKEMLWTTFAL